jgi:hypothetical protein
MDLTELILLLSEIPGVGEKTLGRALERLAARGMAPEELLRRTEQELAGEMGFSAAAAGRIRRVTPTMRQAAEGAARSLRRAGARVLTLQDATYPARLRERLPDPPPVLYAYGAENALDRPTFAAANSNGAPEAALAASDRAAATLVEKRWTPVTGHNRPAYQRTALVARRGGGRVCYVLDRGLLEAFDGDLTRQLFPAAHIWSPAYDPECDLTLSPFPLRAHGIALHNRRRDALLFALADMIIAGEVRPGGEMERRCLEALAQGRSVRLALPESVDRLREAGATPIPAGQS